MPRIARRALRWCTPNFAVRSSHQWVFVAMTCSPHTTHPYNNTDRTYTLYSRMCSHLSYHPACTNCLVSAPCAFYADSRCLAVMVCNAPSWSNHKPRYLNKSTYSNVSSPYCSTHLSFCPCPALYATPSRNASHLVLSVDSVSPYSARKSCRMASNRVNVAWDYAMRTMSSANSNMGNIRPR